MIAPERAMLAFGMRFRGEASRPRTWPPARAAAPPGPFACVFPEGSGLPRELQEIPVDSILDWRTVCLGSSGDPKQELTHESVATLTPRVP
jgi:hypothetical protein